MAVLLAQLPGPINLRLVLSDLKFADILQDLVTAKGNRSGVPRVLSVDHNETRELAGTLHLEGASKDDAIAQIRAINALVTVGTTLTLQSRAATYPVTLNILPSRGVSQPLDELFELDGGPVLASCAFSFTCEPYAYGPTQIVYSQSVTLPNVINIDVPGDYRTPLNIAFNPTSDAVHALYMGMLPNQTTPLLSLLKPSCYAAYSYIGTIATGNPAHVNLPGHGLTTGQTVEFWNGGTTPATNGRIWRPTISSPWVRSSYLWLVSLTPPKKGRNGTKNLRGWRRRWPKLRLDLKISNS